MNLGKFDVILADPPWSYHNWTDAKNGAAVGHYSTMKDSSIADIPVDQWTKKNSVIFLWGTWPCVPEAVHVMEGWGFTHVTGFPWVKTMPSRAQLHTGIGFWTRGASEFVLVGRKGTVKRKKADVIGLLVWESRQFWSPVESHSFKPYTIHQWIEKMFPEARRLELFGRRQRTGWTVLGRKLGHDLGPWGVRPFNPPTPKVGFFRER